MLHWGIADEPASSLLPIHFYKQVVRVPFSSPQGPAPSSRRWRWITLGSGCAVWLLLNALRGDFHQALLTWINLPHAFITFSPIPACSLLPPPFFFKYLVTVYALHAIYAFQPMKNTWRVPHSPSPWPHKSCIAFCTMTWLHGVMGSSLPAAPALGLGHPLGMPVL